MNSDLETAHGLAFMVVGEAFELHFLAERYTQTTNPARRAELAEQFLDHLYALESDFQTLRKAGLLFREMAAYADGRCKAGRHLSASAHSAVISLGLGIVTQCVYVMLCRACPDKWPPPADGKEHDVPSELPSRDAAAPHAAAVIENFQENLGQVLPLDELNELSPRLEQEYARACLRSEAKGKTTPAAPSIVSANEERDKWIYGQAIKGRAWASIMRALDSKPKTWERIGTENGVKDAAKRYAHRHVLPEPQPRKAGRGNTK